MNIERKEIIEKYLIENGISRKLAKLYAVENSDAWKSDVDNFITDWRQKF